MTELPDQKQAAPPGITPEAWRRHALLSVEEMGAADRAAIAGGVPGYQLMTVAGTAVADAVGRRCETGTVAVLCGPGNNGGDGFVAARILAERGWPVKLGLLGPIESLSGDAALAARDWTGGVDALSPAVLDGTDIVIDAVFGAGLNRALEGAAAETLAAVAGRPVIAVDVPSGVAGDSGEHLSGALTKAVATITFFRKKPAHLLLPGREICGDVTVVDIGIPKTALDGIVARAAENHPNIWARDLPRATPQSHKYSSGHVLTVGGPEMIGAARLATRAAQRSGAGFVTVAAPVQQGPLYRLALETAVVKTSKDTRAFVEVLADTRVGCTVIGPGLGVDSPGAHEKVLAVLRAGHPAVLDADALSLFAAEPENLFERIGDKILLTPHGGEFARLFPDLADLPCKLERARQAAERAGAIVLLKGYDTVIADPDGWAIINSNAPPDLATAGTGDVMCGIAAAFIAGGLPVFKAACAAAWVHGEAARTIGPGLIASDLPDRLPAAIDEARQLSGN